MRGAVYVNGRIAPAERENAYRAWLSTKVDYFCELVQSKQGDGHGCGRLQ